MLKVSPRDLFNDANLLKCLGHLALKLGVQDGDPRMVLPKSCIIKQNEATGGTYLAGCWLWSDAGAWSHLRPYNSRDAWPLYVYGPDEQEISVFNEDGTLTPEFCKEFEVV